MRAATSVIGTFETCQPARQLSANRGRPEVIGAWSEWRDGPIADISH